MEELAEKDEYAAEDILLDIAIEKEEVSRLAHSGEFDEEVEEDEEDEPSLDIHLRESLRIMGDWLYRKSKTSQTLAQKEKA